MSKLSGKPHIPHQQYDRSFARVGVHARPGRLIEVRAPDPDNPTGPWTRIWLTEDAAEKLAIGWWLRDALRVALGEPLDGPERSGLCG